MAGRRKTNTKRAAASRKTFTKSGRVILFPTEPSVIGEQKIRDAVMRVIAKKSGDKTRPEANPAVPFPSPRARRRRQM
jgi:hypothetical protein